MATRNMPDGVSHGHYGEPKREGDTIMVRFNGLPNVAADGEVMFESPRKVTAKDGQLTDWFAPFDVHVYRFHLGA